MQASESEQVEQVTLAYCEVAIRWWEAFTGELAVRIDG
jgi:hypothetical protein